jgi:hypothetical protein
MGWMPPNRQYNADEGGTMDDQGVNSLALGSSQVELGHVPDETKISRFWTSIIDCVSHQGRPESARHLPGEKYPRSLIQDKIPEGNRA